MDRTQLDELMRKLNAAGRNYFEVIKAVPFDEIRSLTQHELNKFSITLLYDLAEVHGLIGNAEVIAWLESQRERRKRVRQLQAIKNFRIRGVHGDERLYSAKRVDYAYKDGLMYRSEKNGIAYMPSPEQRTILNESYRAFLDDYESAKAEREGYKKVVAENDTLYVRKVDKRRYKFIIERDNDYVYQHVSDLYDFLHGTYLWGIDRLSLGISPRVLCEVKDGSFPLLHLGDEYMEKEIKYLCDCATVDEIKWLNAIDDMGRFIVTKSVYDVCDVEIITDTVRVIRQMWTGSVRGLEFRAGVCDCNVAVYWYLDDAVYIRAAKKWHKVSITLALKQRLQQISDDLRSTKKSILDKK